MFCCLRGFTEASGNSPHKASHMSHAHSFFGLDKAAICPILSQSTLKHHRKDCISPAKVCLFLLQAG